MEDLDLSKRKAIFSFLVFILTASFLSATSCIVTEQDPKTTAWTFAKRESILGF